MTDNTGLRKEQARSFKSGRNEIVINNQIIIISAIKKT
jgi:hypothetical protein